MRIIYPLCLLIMLLYSCNGNSESDNNAAEGQATAKVPDRGIKERAPANVIVLCDVSKSISRLDLSDTAGFSQRTRSMRQGCKELIRHYPPGSLIKFYLIGSNAFEKPILELQQPRVTQLNRYKVKADLEKNEKLLDDTFDKALDQAENNTCILTSIENAYHTLEIMNPEKTKRTNELVIFSDMVEQCPESPIGKIMMDPQSKSKLLSEKEIDSLTSYSPEIGWQELNVNLQIIMTTPHMSSPMSNQVKAIWKDIFTKLGAKQTASGKIHFQNTASFPPYKSYAAAH